MGTRKLLVWVGAFTVQGKCPEGEWGIEDKLILAELERSPP